jgi:hypothetical protein
MNWLPDMDLNHDKQIQSLLCYRYTIGQAGASKRLNAFFSQSSRSALPFRSVLLAMWLGVLVNVAISGQAGETNEVLGHIETKLRGALTRLQPAPAFEYLKDYRGSLQVTYLPQTFLIHHHDMTGRIATNALEEAGPSYKGFVLRVDLQPLGEVNQAVIPQTLREPYWRTDLDVTTVGGTTNQIFTVLSYGSRTDKELLQNIRRVLKSVAGKELVSTPPKN